MPLQKASIPPSQKESEIILKPWVEAQRPFVEILDCKGVYYDYHGNVTLMTNMNYVSIILLGITMLTHSHLK